MTIDGKGHLNLTEDQKHLSQGLKFKYHGDGVIDRPPTTFVVCGKITGSLLLIFFQSDCRKLTGFTEQNCKSRY